MKPLQYGIAGYITRWLLLPLNSIPRSSSFCLLPQITVVHLPIPPKLYDRVERAYAEFVIGRRRDFEERRREPFETCLYTNITTMSFELHRRTRLSVISACFLIQYALISTIFPASSNFVKSIFLTVIVICYAPRTIRCMKAIAADPPKDARIVPLRVTSSTAHPVSREK